MKILICAATRGEYRACKAGVTTGARETRDKKICYEVLQTGMGLKRAEHSLRNRLKRGERPDLIVSSGLAGAFTSEFEIGAWVVGQSVYCSDESGVRVIDVRIFKPISGFATGGTVVSSDQISFADRAKGLDRITAPIIVDMESAALAKVAAEFDIDFIVLRMISDNPTHPLPLFAADFVSVATAHDWKTRITALRHGLINAATDLKGVARMIHEPRLWATGLTDGWHKLSSNQLLSPVQSSDL